MRKLEDLKDLKTALQFKVASDKLYIFKWSDNSFLAFQYAYKLAEVRGLAIEFVDSFDDIYADDSDMFSINEDASTMRIYSCQKLECDVSALDSIKNAVIICQEVSFDSDYIYEFPKLEEWQIISYMKSQCPGLTDNEIKWLYDITASISKNHENIYRLDNEMKKINCFDASQQEDIFKELSSANGYSDLSPLTIFNFTNAILKKDKLTIMNVLEDLDSIDVEGVGLITILHKNFKQIIDIQMSKNPSAESLGLSYKQFKAIEYNCGKYSSNSLIKVFEFITGLDYKLKSGLLDISNQRLIDYIVCSVLSY